MRDKSVKRLPGLGSRHLIGSVQRAAKDADRTEDRLRPGRPEPETDREGECHRCYYIIF